MSRRLSILWLSHLLPYPPIGGVRQRSHGLLSEVSRHHDVTLAAFNQTALTPASDVEAALAALRKICKVDRAFPIKADRGPWAKRFEAVASVLGGNPYTLRWLESRDFFEHVRGLAAATQFDAVHFDTISLAPYAGALPPSVPKVLTHHNIESQMLLRRAGLESSAFMKWYFRQEGERVARVEQRFANEFKAHVVCSDLDGERLHELVGGATAITIPNGVDTSFFVPRPDAVRKPKSLIFAGGLTWYPNVSAVKFLVEKVWPRFADDADATLTIIGRSPPAWLTDAAARDPRITATGFVDDVRPYFDASAVYVCPIFDGGGTKLKVLDALAMGLPLVGNPIACEGIDVVDGTHVELAESPEQFEAKIRKIWNDDALAKRMSCAALDLIHGKYAFATIGKALADVYAGLAGVR